MGSKIAALAIDCRDAESLAAFWCAALDYSIILRFTDAHGVTYVEAGRDGEPTLVFQPVPDNRAGKNRVHLDVRASGPQSDEVARLVALGARVRAGQPELPWVVMHDPEGNEFCVLPAKRQ